MIGEVYCPIRDVTDHSPDIRHPDSPVFWSCDITIELVGLQRNSTHKPVLNEPESLGLGKEHEKAVQRASQLLLSIKQLNSKLNLKVDGKDILILENENKINNHYKSSR